MKPFFSVSVDVPLDLVRITLGGFFTQDDIQRFLAAREIAHAQLRCGPNQHLTLADVRGLSIQMQEIVGAWRQVLAAPEYRSRRLAFVQGQSLTRLQLQRAAVNRDVRYFNDMAKAEAWVLSADAADSGGLAPATALAPRRALG